MQACQGYRDVDFFKQDVKTNRSHKAIVLTMFYLYTKENSNFGLDELRIKDPWKELPKHKVYWTAHAVIRDLGWLSEVGAYMLQQDLRMPLDRLELFVERGEVEVLLRGRLSHIPQYMNSKSFKCQAFVSLITPFVLLIRQFILLNRSALIVNQNRHYIIRSFHIRTYANSRKFLDQYRVQHFIVEICKKGKKSKSNRDSVTVEWLVQEYQSMWADATKLRTVKGAPPKQCDIVHYLALHVEYLNEWASHSGPISKSTWLEFAKQVISAREQAKQKSIKWGYFLEDKVTITSQQTGLLSSVSVTSLLNRILDTKMI
jgi:hypothetical protein